MILEWWYSDKHQDHRDGKERRRKSSECPGKYRENVAAERLLPG